VNAPPAPPAPAADNRASRTPPLADTPALAAKAVEFLRTPPQSLAPLTADDARQVVPFLRLVAYPKGAAVLREGDLAGGAYLLLLLEGEVEVDAGKQAPAVAIGVLGPGSMIGEMSLLDGAPRSANCTALSPVLAAGLTKKGIEALMAAQPVVAAKLAFAIAQRIGERLRGLGQQLQVYNQLSEALQSEVDRLRGR